MTESTLVQVLVTENFTSQEKTEANKNNGVTLKIKLEGQMSKEERNERLLKDNRNEILNKEWENIK